LTRGAFLRGHQDIEQLPACIAPPSYLPASILLDQTHGHGALRPAMGAREVVRGLNRQHARFTRRTVGAEGLPVLVAIGASAGAAGDSHLVQVSGDPQGRREIHVTETTETVAAAEPTRRPETRGTRHPSLASRQGDHVEFSRSDQFPSSPGLLGRHPIYWAE